jgi:hypothetical protein
MVNILRSGNERFVCFLWLDAAIAIAIMFLLLATAASRHLVLPQRLYLGVALIGFLGSLVLLSAGGETLRYNIEGAPAVALMFLAPWLPYILFAEVAVLCWLGTRKP